MFGNKSQRGLNFFFSMEGRIMWNLGWGREIHRSKRKEVVSLVLFEGRLEQKSLILC